MAALIIGVISTLKVSIIIPTYNYAQYIPDALKSCLSQTYRDIEIIVVDDGSTDHTREVVTAFPGVQYLYQDHAGVSSARNRGWRAAKGQYFQFLDADDVMMPSKIEKCLEVFEAHPELGVVYTDYEIRTADLSKPALFQPTDRVLAQGEVLEQLVRQPRSPFVPSCAMVARTFVESIGGFNEQLEVAEDWLFWVSMAANGVLFAQVPEVLVWYRDTPDSLSKHELLMAFGRLSAYEHLVDLPIPKNILILNDALADRHHVVAAKLWKHNRVAEARIHLVTALKLQRKGRAARLLLLSLTTLTSFETAERLFGWLEPKSTLES